MDNEVYVSCTGCGGSGKTINYSEEELSKEYVSPEDGELKDCPECNGVGSWSVPKPEKED